MNRKMKINMNLIGNNNKHDQKETHTSFKILEFINQNTRLYI